MKTQSFRLAVVLIPFFFCISGCTHKDDGLEWGGAITEEMGTVVVSNPKAPVYQTGLLSLREDLTIGDTLGSEEYMFSNIRQLVVSGTGDIYVLDSKESHIKVFDKEGIYIHTIGKRGQGPGELDNARLISINNDRLVVTESGRRLSFFDLDGTFQRNIPTGDKTILWTMIDSKGKLMLMTAIFSETSRYNVAVYDQNLNLLYDIASTPTPVPQAYDPFLPIAYQIIDYSDHIIYGYPERYEIDIFSPEGKKVRRILRDYDPVPISEKELAERTEGMPPGIKLDPSKYHSAFGRFFPDDEGRLYVQTWKKDGTDFFYDIFDRQGRYLLQTKIPERPFICRGGKLYCVVEDEEGYQQVKRYEMSWLE